MRNPDPEIGSSGMLPKASLNHSARRDLPIRIGHWFQHGRATLPHTKGMNRLRGTKGCDS